MEPWRFILCPYSSLVKITKQKYLQKNIHLYKTYTTRKVSAWRKPGTDTSIGTRSSSCRYFRVGWNSMDTHHPYQRLSIGAEWCYHPVLLVPGGIIRCLWISFGVPQRLIYRLLQNRSYIFIHHNWFPCEMVKEVHVRQEVLWVWISAAARLWKPLSGFNIFFQ